MHVVTVRLARLLPILGIAAACGDPPARVRLVPVTPIDGGTCGRPSGATGLKITAYAPSGEVARAVGLDAAVDLGDFPADTEQLAVEVVVGGGVVGAAGKTAPLRFLDLPDGAEIPIFMAPPDGFCPVGDLATARIAPLVARAGDGILIVGGVDRDGRALATAERFDPATGTFTAVAVPEVLGERGFVGAVLAPLPDGRVVLSGGPQPVITIYDPDAHAFGESVLVEARAFHVAIALDATRVLVAGGCTEVVAGACAGVVRKSSKIYDTGALGSSEPGPALRASRIGAAVFDVGVQADGRRRFVVAGGAPSPDAADPAGADRFPLDSDATELAGSHAQAAALDGGGVLTAFAVDGAPADGAAAVFAPDATTARAVARAPDLEGARLVTLEDGRVLALGGAPGPEVARYDPMLDAWQRFAPAAAGPDGLASPAVIRLDDGAVLVLGGRALDTGDASPRAWIFRSSLVGATTGALTVIPTGEARANVLTPADPATVTRGEDWVLAAPDGALARALVGGPRPADGAIRAVVRVRRGGVALVAQQRGPGEAVVAELAPGAPVRLVRTGEGAARPPCTGSVVAPFDPAVPATLELSIAGGTARVSRDGAALLTCAVDGPGRGAWGVAALGGEIAVGTVSVAR